MKKMRYIKDLLLSTKIDIKAAAIAINCLYIYLHPKFNVFNMTCASRYLTSKDNHQQKRGCSVL